MKQASIWKIFLLIFTMKWWRLFQLNTTDKRFISKIIRTKLLFFLIFDVTLICWKSCRREIGFKSSINILLLRFSFPILATALNEKGFVFPYMDHNRGVFTHQVFDAYDSNCKEIQRNLWKADWWLLAVSGMERTASFLGNSPGL